MIYSWKLSLSLALVLARLSFKCSVPRGQIENGSGVKMNARAAAGKPVRVSSCQAHPRSAAVSPCLWHSDRGGSPCYIHGATPRQLQYDCCQMIEESCEDAEPRSIG